MYGSWEAYLSKLIITATARLVIQHDSVITSDLD